MAGSSSGRGPLAAAALAAALAAGFGGGWVAGRAALPPPPRPDAFRNPLATVRKGEVLVLLAPDGAREQVQVLETAEDSVLLSIRRVVTGSPDHVRQIRVARTYPGFFLQLEGDLDPRDAEAAVRNFVLESMEPDDLVLEHLGRTVRCWKLKGTYRGSDPRTYWMSDEFPVHGLLRADGAKGKAWEIESFQEGR